MSTATLPRNTYEMMEDHAVVIDARGFRILIDLEDLPVVRRHIWFTQAGQKTRYARTALPISRKIVYLHRLLLNAAKGQRIDHWNGNGLDCRRTNLRPATHAQNLANSGPHADSTSGFKGVHYLKADDKWEARLMVDGKLLLLGHFSTAVEAAKAYNEAVKKHRPEFGWLNPIPDD